MLVRAVWYLLDNLVPTRTLDLKCLKRVPEVGPAQFHLLIPAAGHAKRRCHHSSHALLCRPPPSLDVRSQLRNECFPLRLLVGIRRCRPCITMAAWTRSGFWLLVSRMHKDQQSSFQSAADYTWDQ